ncbi:nucleoside-diphosphate sugar epimerase/dehydratase [Emticicia sp. BO119]|uniref:polysaccharide biosynthesis protein n=1 Tax=Emticicia sp. BO119 TaxID=2757768 RepID=UPI0015F0ED7A|nr:nucleoside-diphosphate sugar epimerase/dehydratase [Emticicia sp. BO119]MBA4853949.1 polysaccharide biosynthesis protein [Emticicia sp. BO119]
MTNFLRKYTEKFASKWLILLVDLLICFVTFTIAIFVHFNFELTYVEPSIYKYHLLFVLSIRAIFFIFFKSYEGIIRHTSMEDAALLLKVVTISSIFIFLLSNFGCYHNIIYLCIPPRITIISYFITLFALIFSRFLVKGLYDSFFRKIKLTSSVIIYGTGYMGLITKNSLLNDKVKNYKVLCFIDDNSQKINKTVEGIRVLSRDEAIEKYLTNSNSKEENIEVIFAIQNISPLAKAKIAEDFLTKGIILKSIPPINKWIKGELTTKQIQRIEIDDLLERDPIAINNKFVERFINNKRILVTGAAGSIGSELVKQLIKFSPKKIILVDQAESALYDLESELIRTSLSEDREVPNIRVDVYDVTNEKLMDNLFYEEQPQVIFHAAAYKHVPLMEKNPYQAVRVNMLGTKIVANLASKYNTEKFVMISTDKAVNPTNVMGATKRLAEMYVQGLDSHHNNNTRFIITRFGNVLGSNGSVIPLFKKQIEKGGPITVTHKDIIRYFMTIPEACQLVLEAGTMGKGGEIYVFDMGKPVKILDLAKKMVQLSGLELGRDIQITFTGLRPGEKLYEELLNSNENTQPTYHHKIMIAKVIPEDYDLLNIAIKNIELAIAKTDNNLIVTELKKLIPEYISNNSIYENLDTLEESSLNS